MFLSVSKTTNKNYT